MRSKATWTSLDVFELPFEIFDAKSWCVCRIKGRTRIDLSSDAIRTCG
jgi:hypothetical protein